MQRHRFGDNGYTVCRNKRIYEDSRAREQTSNWSPLTQMKYEINSRQQRLGQLGPGLGNSAEKPRRRPDQRELVSPTPRPSTSAMTLPTGLAPTAWPSVPIGVDRSDRKLELPVRRRRSIDPFAKRAEQLCHLGADSCGREQGQHLRVGITEAALWSGCPISATAVGEQPGGAARTRADAG
jgi:hypothetical protein